MKEREEQSTAQTKVEGSKREREVIYSLSKASKNCPRAVGRNGREEKKKWGREESVGEGILCHSGRPFCN